MLIPMKRFRIAGSKGAAGKLIKGLYRFGCFHVTSPSTDPALKDTGMDIGVFSEEAAEKFRRSESLLADIQAALAALPRTDGGPPESCPWPVPGNDWLSDEAFQVLYSSAGEIMDVSRHIDRLQKQIDEILQYRKMYEEFLPLIEMVVSSANVELIGVAFPKEFENAYQDLEEDLEQITGGAFSIFRSSQGEAGGAALVVYPASMREKIMRQAVGKKARPVHLPKQYSRDTFASTLKCLFESENEFHAELEKECERLTSLSKERRDLLLTAFEGLGLAIAPLRTRHFLAHSSSAFWITGWVPEKECAGLQKFLEEEFSGAVLMYILPPSREEYEDTPVELRNVPWARPFERLLRVYSLPQYGTIDPTPVMAFTVPLFFGLILGDLGYAALLAGIGYLLKRSRPHDSVLQDAAAIIMPCAVMSGIFGVVYGEFFGKLWGQLGLPPPLWDRKEETVHMLYIVILVGWGHVMLGSGLGAWNGWRLGFAGKAVEKLCDVVLLASLPWIVLGSWSGAGAGWSVAVPVAAFIVKLFAGKFMEVVTEAPKLFSNILSYSRLMALGLASIIMADLADDLLGSGLWIGFAIPALVLMHALNFAIGVLSPAIQAIRLHYVEFFSQFYSPRGIPFSPLK
ncbi:MAG: hypothetical protein HZA01_12405 [Nitrospinae bacterium]|nr:hypothetical protein [Nitrospinota bacterium]